MTLAYVSPSPRAEYQYTIPALPSSEKNHAWLPDQLEITLNYTSSRNWEGINFKTSDV